jgi:hypothetical protein
LTASAEQDHGQFVGSRRVVAGCALLSALVGCDGCGRECDPPGSVWCEGGVVCWCEEVGSSMAPETRIRSMPCDPGLTCLDFPQAERMYDYMESDAACIDLRRCAGRQAFCVGQPTRDVLVRCGSGEPTLDSCGLGAVRSLACHCEESEDDASCVDLDALCPWQ